MTGSATPRSRASRPFDDPHAVDRGVGVLDKATAILDVIERAPASPAHIAAATGISRNTVLPLLRSMVSLGLVAPRDGQFRLGPRIARLAAAADRVPMTNAGAEKLAPLRDATGASAVRLHQRYGSAGTARVCFAEALDLHTPERSQLGMPVPLRPDCVTQTFLAWQAGLTRGPYTPEMLTWTRRRGWAQGFIGRDRRLAIVAVPVFDQRKRVVAVLSISGPVENLTTTPGRVHGRALIKAASSDLISECLQRSAETAVLGAPARTVSNLLTNTRRGVV